MTGDECGAYVQIFSGAGSEAELGCDLSRGHEPKIHWDRHVKVHWFQLSEDGAGHTIKAAMVSTLDT